MKHSTSVLVAVAITLASVTANPIDIPKRAVDPQFSPFLTCIRQKHANFPAEGKPTAQEIRSCLDEAKASTNSKAKREAEVASTTPTTDEEEELLYNPDEKRAVEPRYIIDSVTRLGKSLYLDKKATWCAGQSVHDNFVWVEDIVSRSKDVCSQLKDQINSSGVKEDGGVGLVIDKLTNGHDKQGHQLKDKRKVTASYLLNFAPPAKMTIDEIKELSTGVYDLCNDGFERIATKGEGCTQDIKYYRPSKAKHYTDTGAIGGTINMYLGDSTSQVADLIIDFFNDD
jgi:hypothetical protein